MNYCPSCGKPVADEDRFCGNCGTAIKMSDAAGNEPAASSSSSGPVATSGSPSGSIAFSGRRGRCKYCGNAVQVGVTPCPHCAHELKWTTPKRSPKMDSSIPSLASLRKEENEAGGAMSISLGVLSLVGCLFPIVGVPMAIVGLVVSGSKKNMVGGILCTVGLILSIVNAISGGIKGAQAEREYEMRRNADQFIQEWNKAFR